MIKNAIQALYINSTISLPNSIITAKLLSIDANISILSKWDRYTDHPTIPKTVTFSIFLNNSNSVLTWNKFLKYFVGFNLSSFGTSGAVATSGPTCIKSPIIAIKAATNNIEPIIPTAGMIDVVKIYVIPISSICLFGICSYKVLYKPTINCHINGARRLINVNITSSDSAVDTSLDFTTCPSFLALSSFWGVASNCLSSSPIQ